MIIKQIDHIAFCVSDIEKSTAFYRDILGFPLAGVIDDGPKDLVYFDIPGAARMELFDFHGKSVKPKIEKSECDPLGFVHLAFLVDDVDEWAKHLAEHNVPITYGPESLPHIGVRVCLFEDPDGNTLEVSMSLEG